ncbi:MAG TPA: TonB-dependent receptor [Caulobacteraceae bacterium]|nr:TonB-dependent receptor [Caulobacteraceae bacterium]
MAKSRSLGGTSRLALLLLAGAAWPLAGSASAQTTSPRPAADTTAPQSQVAEVIVTATKREQTLQSAPLAVTALTGQVITKMGGSDFADIAGAVPGLSLESDRAGENQTYIRGISEVAGAAPTVGVYMDEIPITTFSGEQVNLKTFDVSRVEVLRGPQGTLYGEGSEGGTIRIVTNKPNSTAYQAEIYAVGSGTDHGGANGEVDGMVNIPLVTDKLALRLDALWSDYDGWITNPIIGKTHYNTDTDFTGRATLRFTPDDKTTVDLAYMHQYANSDGPSQGDANYVDFAGTAEPRNDRFDVYSLTVSHDFGFATLTSATGYFERGSLSHNDFTSVAPILSLLFGVPVRTADIVRPNDQNSITEEVRLVSDPGGPLAWTLGGFYKHDSIDIANTSETNPVLPVSVFNLSVDDTSNQYAVFGEGDYAITGQLHLVAGLRYFSEDRDTTSAVGGLLPLVLSGTSFSGMRQTASNSQLTPKISLNYKFSDDALVYVTASSGFRAGDINPYAFLFPGAPSSFGPEKLWNYEIGAKTSWLDRRLVINAAVYDIEWQDIIINAAAPNPLFGYSVNGGSAHSTGVELEATAIPVTGLTLSFAGDYDDAKIDHVSTAGAGVLATPGATLPFAPKVKLYGSAEYDFPVMETGWSGRARVDVSYNGLNYSNISDLPATINHPYTTVNLRAGVSRDHLDLTVFADNVGDERGELVALDNGTGESVLIRPRTIGVSLDKRF